MVNNFFLRRMAAYFCCHFVSSCEPFMKGVICIVDNSSCGGGTNSNNHSSNSSI